MTEQIQHSDVAAPTPPPVSSDPGRHQGLILTAALAATAVALAGGGYGFAAEVFVLKAIAFPVALAAAAFWAAWFAARVRQHVCEPSAAEPMGRERPAWAEQYEETGLEDIDTSRSRQGILLAIAAAVIGISAFFTLRSEGAAGISTLTSGCATVIAVVCLATSCVWLVLARSFVGVLRDELPEAPALAAAGRECHWLGVLAAAATLASLVWTPTQLWLGRALLVWTIVLAIEQVVRTLVASWSKTDQKEDEEPELTAAIELAMRDAVFVRGNPLASLFATIEDRFGVSLRSSWAIRFVRCAAIPSIALVLVLLWGLSSLSVVQVDELGVRQSFGRIERTPLKPGLHLKLPWPFGRVLRYPVKRISTLPLGFVAKSQDPTPILWTQTHAQEEFALVLGDGAEVVAVDAVVYYKIHEDPARFLDYVFQFQNPIEALEVYAYRGLMQETCTKTLQGWRPGDIQMIGRLSRALPGGSAGARHGSPDRVEKSTEGLPGDDVRMLEETVGQASGSVGRPATTAVGRPVTTAGVRDSAPAGPTNDILSGSREDFAATLTQSLREYSERNRLGIEVIDVALINLHPPVEAADDYLDVISAAIDRKRMVIEARGESDSKIHEAEAEKDTDVSDARVEAAQKVGRAIEEYSQLLELNEAVQVSPDNFKRRLWIETFEEKLADKWLFVIDKTFAVGPGETVLDLRTETPGELPKRNGAKRNAR